MIRYSLKCEQGHQFESWFQSADAFDVLASKELLSCTVCGSAHVQKAIMAPKVVTKAVRQPLEAEPTPVTANVGVPQKAEAPKMPAPEEIIAKMRDYVESNHDYVGDSFAKEARAIHEGQADARPIWGEAKPKEVQSLVEDGIQVAPLPFVPKKKVN